jgi:predicted nucleotidyltransferase
MEALERVLGDDPLVAYALVFGSAARGTNHGRSDVDVAIGGAGGRRLTALELGELRGVLAAAGRGR